MSKLLMPGLLLALLFIPQYGFPQKPVLHTPQQRLLLEMAATFVLGEKDFMIDFDSAVVEASIYNRMDRILLIGEGFYEHPEGIQNTWPDEGNVALLRKNLHGATAVEKAKLLTLLGAMYVFRPGSQLSDMRNAYDYLTKAKVAAQDAGQPALVNQALILLGKYYLERQQFDTAAICFKEVIHAAEKSGDKATEAKAWYYWGLYHPFDMNSFDERRGYLEKALTLYKQMNNEEKQALCYYYIGGLQYFVNGFPESREAFLTALRICRKIRFPYTHYPNFFLATALMRVGHYPDGMVAALDAMKTVGNTADSLSYGNIYHLMGNLSDKNGVGSDEDIFWYKKAMQEYIKFGNPGMYKLIIEMTKYMNHHDQSKAALRMIQDIMKKYPPLTPVQMQDAAMALGNTYAFLGRNDLAEEQLLKGERLERSAELMRGNVYKAFLYTAIGTFYLRSQQFQKSRKYYNKALMTENIKNDPDTYVSINFALYQIDSAEGKYFSALQHYQGFRRTSDSLFSMKAGLVLNEMSVKYKAEKNESDIKLLTKQGELKEAQLKQSRFNNNIVIGSAIILALLSGLLYNRYRLKQKSNQQLEAKQTEINQKNAALLSLVNDKDVLLEEKEWLIKEIHHRVKNNLQIVISLLNTQSKYLDSEEAIRAINESRHRMQAMSLIHQKLYQSENVAFVNMQTYIRELSGYLEASFNSSKNIYFELNVDPIELDISQAIPIGLILNETITNAIKYAFVNTESGMISIAMKSIDGGEVMLDIRDNGVGLPEDFEVSKGDSMGMRLVRGLVKQIDGKLLIARNHGTCIKITFGVDNNLKSITTKELLNAEPNLS